MKITADTNILVRAIMEDDKRQAKLAQSALAEAELVAVTLPALCELACVLSQGYRISAADIAASIRGLMNAENVKLDRPAVEAGLAQLEAGGDFADAIIAHTGSWLGADCFVSFDRKAARLLEAQGQKAHLLG